MLEIGEVVGSYVVESEIGQGGMASVYKARHSKLDRAVAIKVMHRNLLQDDTFRARFAREAKIVALLEHANIVPIYDYDEHNGQPYLVMRYIDGPTLKRYAIKRGLTPQETYTIMRAVASGLDFAHDRDILHRDIKPSNILVDSADNQPYITDFGLARMAQAGESTMSHDLMLGTPFYISPEQAQGEKNLDRRTDVYSFGVILYELITGFVPFSADTPYAIVHGHIYAQPEAPSQRNPNLPPEVDAVLLRALAKKPQDRYASAGELVADFGQAIGTAPNNPILPSKVNAEPVRPQATPTQHQGHAPINPAPEIITDKRGKKVAVESRIDLGNLDLSKIDLKIMGKQFEEGITNFASMIEDKIDSEIAKQGGYVDEQGNPNEKEIRKRVEKRLKARQELVTHAVIFAMINTMLFIIWVFSSGIGSFPWPFIVLMGWGAGMFAHWYEYRNEYGAGAAKMQAQMQAEVEAEMTKLQQRSPDKAKHKAKNHERLAEPEVRLNEDGELTDSFVDEIARHDKR